MVDFEAFGDLLRNAIKDIEGGGARDIVQPVERDVSSVLGGLRRDISGGARYIVKPLGKAEADVGNLFGGLRRDVSSTFRRDIEGVGSNQERSQQFRRLL